MDLNHRPSGYAYYFGFRRSAAINGGFVVWTFPSPGLFRTGACHQVSTPFPSGKIQMGLGSGLPC